MLIYINLSFALTNTEETKNEVIFHLQERYAMGSL